MTAREDAAVDLVSRSEIADLFGVSRRTVETWADRSRHDREGQPIALAFPEPEWVLGSLRFAVWRRETIVDWGIASGRLPT